MEDLLSKARTLLSAAGFMSIPCNWADALYAKGEINVELVVIEDALRIFAAHPVAYESGETHYAHAIVSKADKVESALSTAILEAQVRQKEQQRQKKTKDLLARAIAYLADTESTPDEAWWRDYFLMSGDEMYLTDYSWEPRENAEAYLEDAKAEYPDRWREEMDGLILDSVNVPEDDPLYPPAPGEEA